MELTMLKLMKKILIIILIVSIPFPLFAQPLMTDLQSGQKAPWPGRLFNAEAISKMIVENEIALEQCKNDGQQELDREKARCEFLLENAKTTIELEHKKNDEIIKLKNKEIDELHEIIATNLNNADNYIWWFTGGVIIGITTSITIFYAAVEVSK